MIQDKYHVEKGVILTAGGEGAYWYDGEHEYHAPAYEVEPVDTTECRRLLYRWIAVFIFWRRKKRSLCIEVR